MKKFLNNRVLPIVCALSILVSLCVVPASAAWDSDRDVLDTNEISIWNSKLVQPPNMQLYIEYFGAGASVTYGDVFWKIVDGVVNRTEVGEVGIETLEMLCSKYNTFFNQPMGTWLGDQVLKGSKEIANDIVAQAFLGKLSLTFEVRSRGTSGMKRIYCPEVDAWVVNSAGQYAYVNEAYIVTSGGNHWISKSSAETNRSKSQVLTGSQLKQTLATLQLAGEPAYIGSFANKFKAIYRDGREVYANPDGYPFVAAADDAEWAINQSRPDTSVKDENGNQVEGLPDENITNIDLSGMTVTLPDGSINFIDKLIYDESSKTYYIDSHDTYTTINNYYIDIRYSWTYHINYTSITYIGQTEEYNKYYEVYYELPDGRDSADLTREELEQLNVSIDVIPYGRSADDTSLRSLYHFDGDTRDSSYWNYCTDFIWNKGASLTYMDAAVFNGALYLDEQEHDFTLTLPSNITSADFTIQFRYYQSYTAAPQTDSYIKLGDSTVFQFNGGQFLNGSGSALANTPIGSWNEIALIRDSGTLYYYLNGVSIGNVSNTTAFSDKITFHFGSSQQTYKYFDELRILNYAFQNGGLNYSPTSVPFDTNLSLVLPTDSVPVADEYWQITSSKENLFTYDVSSGRDCGFTCYPDSQLPNQTDTSDPLRFPTWGFTTGKSSFEFYDGYFRLTSNFDYLWAYDGSGSYGKWWWYGSGLSTMLWRQGISSTPSAQYLADGDYVLSVVLLDGTVCSFSFTVKMGVTEGNKKADFDWGEIGFYSMKTYGYQNRTPQCWLYIKPKLNTSVDILHIELCKGTETDLKAELVTSITPMTPDQLNTPTLAVRTDLDITSYQIGGVRPSLPEKGQVWAMVEGGYITSIQIYNGQAWEGCDGRIWTGERWVPARSYNVITMQDMYDIVDSTPNYEYIYSEAGFWSWWQKSWNAFVERLFIALGSGGVGTSGASGGAGSSEMGNVDLDAEDMENNPDEEDGKSFWQFIVLVVSGGKSVVRGVRHMFSGVVSLVPQSMELISGSFDSGGVAVGAFDGSTADPDAGEIPAVYSNESEVNDPWRYR